MHCSPWADTSMLDNLPTHAKQSLQNVVVVAGRAAQRLTETSGRQATTIHRLLQWMPQRTDRAGLSVEAGGRFKFNAR